ncbi:GNAT family N-acetyltransferase [Parasphingopyxis marina]|uniref:GNAT family N-acetyltransferase n=1 Tax=Parasphingopyxis marina TaxID=2761622 RepID=A0A842I3N8_9SPHN|nr:GNAT family N-acetyltransferase [Parasphingopyxis marina]MBC2778664.1 GNAT family N-acetyltransferase [Parasphingopyxis marina]
MTAPPEIRPASPEERARAIDTIVLGFAADPLCRWIWPEGQTYLSAMAKLTEAFGGKAFDEATAYITPDFEAAALWLPPGVEPDAETMGALVAETVAPERLEEIGTFMAMQDDYHPEGEHWYLPLIAADPAHLGKGLGGALMKHALAVCDETGTTAYLESSNPRNISLYQRHGFEIMGEIQHGSSPVMTPMIREARQG